MAKTLFSGQPLRDSLQQRLQRAEAAAARLNDHHTTDPDKTVAQLLLAHGHDPLQLDLEGATTRGGCIGRQRPDQSALPLPFSGHYKLLKLRPRRYSSEQPIAAGV